MTAAEAYPLIGEIDPTRWTKINYVGPLSMFAKAGFEVVEKNGDYSVVRRVLYPTSDGSTRRRSAPPRAPR